MLVVSRRTGETIEFPSVGVVVRVVGLGKSRIQLGVEAPREIAIMRGELVKNSSAASNPANDYSRPSANPPPATAPEPMSPIEASILALAEMSDPANRGTARTIAKDAIEQLNQVESFRSVALPAASVRQSPSSYAIASSV
ncbi:carbon storage regulator [Rubripirellula lacrimiformis]|uniref:Translational regulator CsrA n=1 Tax=Rubripirellula lacrimiformis TaxID=1930273 RepID=A0A517N3G4_9BACT|nr:carbon storage regulator [Rubripirellula lacrimiformis]QDT01675.1 carbon storage regulator [Rubripirellula lacrimiformis]